MPVRSDSVADHWSPLVRGSNASALAFYASIETEVAAREGPGVPGEAPETHRSEFMHPDSALGSLILVKQWNLTLTKATFFAELEGVKKDVASRIRRIAERADLFPRRAHLG
jgi:hypothetical protein